MHTSIQTDGSSSSNPTIQRATSVGRIACVPPDMVVLVPDGLPHVYGFSVDGSLRWTTTVDAYTPFPYIESSDGVSNPVPEGGGNFLAGLAPAPNGWVVLQIATRSPETIEDGRSWDDLDTYAVRARTGEGAYLGDDYPLLAQVGDSTATAVRESPYPRVTVYRAEVDFPARQSGES